MFAVHVRSAEMVVCSWVVHLWFVTDRILMSLAALLFTEQQKHIWSAFNHHRRLNAAVLISAGSGTGNRVVGSTTPLGASEPGLASTHTQSPQKWVPPLWFQHIFDGGVAGVGWTAVVEYSRRLSTHPCGEPRLSVWVKKMCGPGFTVCGRFVRKSFRRLHVSVAQQM